MNSPHIDPLTSSGFVDISACRHNVSALLILNFVFAFTVLFSDLLGLRFHAIVFNYHTIAADDFVRVSPVNATEAYPWS